LKQEGKCNLKELMQRAQVIGIYNLETDANILNFQICFQDNKGMDLEEDFDERHEYLFFQILFLKLKKNIIMFQFKKKIIIYMSHWK
jgi:hypothetical protein